MRRRTSDAADAADVADPGCALDAAEGFVVLLAVVAAVLFLVFIGVPFLIALGELVLVLLLAVAGVVGRVFFRRPWTVDAVDPGGAHHTWSIVGWKASGAARRYIADRLVATGAAPTADEVHAAVLAP